MTMMHPGLPLLWSLIVIGVMLVFSFWTIASPLPSRTQSATRNLIDVPVVGAAMQRLLSSHSLLLSLKIIMVLFFLTVIVAGLFGTPIPERNFATILTWNIWWAGLVFSIMFLGSAWCAVCPWDAIAQWLVRRRLWRRAEPNNSLNLKVPRRLQNVWLALWMFILLTWLELGVGITINPYATAVLSLFIVVMATVSLAVFQRKAFCRNFCPVGRTVGFYSQLAPIELRPIKADTCASCKTLDCYHGNAEVEPCPTWLVMGSLKQNSYCTSCGNCTQSCPHQNIAWRLRAPSIEAIQGARPRWDEAWFMLGLLALTAFHGITMMPFWELWMSDVARLIGDSGLLLWSFSIGLLLCLLLVVGAYGGLVALARLWTKTTLEYHRCFSAMAFVALPLAFSYHMAHNLNHLIRESVGVSAVFLNPLGVGTLPLTTEEKHQRHFDMLISQDVLHLLQAGLMVMGFIIAVQTIRHRGLALSPPDQRFSGLRISPVLFFAVAVTAFHLWLLAQPMIMRM